MERKSRPIRMSDLEWSTFKTHFGTEWLRAQIDKVIRAEKRNKPEPTKAE